MEAVSYFTRSSITTAPMLPLIHHQHIAPPVVHCCLILKGKEKHPVCRDTTHFKTLHFHFWWWAACIITPLVLMVLMVLTVFVLTQQISFWIVHARAISLAVFLPFICLFSANLSWQEMRGRPSGLNAEANGCGGNMLNDVLRSNNTTGRTLIYWLQMPNMMCKTNIES